MAANKSVEKALKILGLISSHPDGLSLTDIYKELKMPKATVYDILQALYKEDAIYYKDQHLKTYVIGSRIFAIGQAYTKNSNFINFAGQSLKQFAEKYDLTAFACKRLSDKLTYIYKYESPRTKITTTDVGVQIPLYLDAAGKVFLAYVKKERQEELLKDILENDFNGVETKEYKKILDDLIKIKSLGYCLDDGESTDYICVYAVPVFNFENKIVGALSATRIMDKKNNVMDEINELLEIAQEVSKKQGYVKRTRE